MSSSTSGQPLAGLPLLMEGQTSHNMRIRDHNIMAQDFYAGAIKQAMSAGDWSSLVTVASHIYNFIADVDRGVDVRRKGRRSKSSCCPALLYY